MTFFGHSHMVFAFFLCLYYLNYRKTILEYLLLKTNLLKLEKVIKNHPFFYLLSTFL